MELVEAHGDWWFLCTAFAATKASFRACEDGIISLDRIDHGLSRLGQISGRRPGVSCRRSEGGRGSCRHVGRIDLLSLLLLLRQPDKQTGLLGLLGNARLLGSARFSRRPPPD